MDNWFNPAAFRQAEPFTPGNAPRTLGDCRTPTQFNIDLSVRKSVNVTENTRISFRVEALNFTNTAKFRAPESRSGNPQFGRIREQAGFPRIIQWTLRYEF